MKNYLDMPSGKIYGDTLILDEKLEVLELVDIESEQEFIEELGNLAQIIDLNKFKNFIYQDGINLFSITYKELYNELI